MANFPSSLVGLENFRRAYGAQPITSEMAQPFLDLEKDKQRSMQARLFAGPIGAAAVHMAPVIPMGGHMTSISQAVPQLLGMHMNALPAGASMAEMALHNLAPTMAMGSLGIGGAVGAGYLVHKLLSKLRQRKLDKQRAAQGML